MLICLISNPGGESVTAKKINVIGYRDIAAKLGVSVKYIHNLAGTGEMSDPDFPQPTTPEWMRSPGFDEDDVDRWIALRAARAQRGKSGRPPALGYTRIQAIPAPWTAATLPALPSPTRTHRRSSVHRPTPTPSPSRPSP